MLWQRKTAITSTRQFIRRLLKVAAYMFLTSVILSGGYKVLKIGYGGVLSQELFEALYPSRTTGLLPAYFAVLLTVFAALTYIIDVRDHYNRVFWATSVIGRTSLFAFVAQFVVIWTIPSLLGWKWQLCLGSVALLCLIGIVVCSGLCYIYGRLRRWITKDDYSKLLSLSATH